MEDDSAQGPQHSGTNVTPEDDIEAPSTPLDLDETSLLPPAPGPQALHVDYGEHAYSAPPEQQQAYAQMVPSYSGLPPCTLSFMSEASGLQGAPAMMANSMGHQQPTPQWQVCPTTRVKGYAEDQARFTRLVAPKPGAVQSARVA